MGNQFSDFELDETVVASFIYGEVLHFTTPTGVVLDGKVKAELDRFLVEWNRFLKVQEVPFYRIDAYFSENALHILEVNCAFVDGWGNALNLSRAAGIAINPLCLTFPTQFATVEQEYLPELMLLISELNMLGKIGHRIVPYSPQPTRPTYVYGRVESQNANSLPFDGLRLDNKLNLAAFSRIWQSKFVRIPQHFTVQDTPWEDIPTDTVLKFVDKNSAESIAARASVLIGKPQGKAKFLRGCYENGTLLAQAFVPPTVHELGNTQLIILTTGNTPVTGYVQFSRKTIINDNSVHGPLCIG